MKCPKCGYNSFEHNDACPKCSADITGFKGTFGLAPLVFPQAVRAAMAETMMASLTSTEHEEDHSEAAHDDMFAFDLPDDLPKTAPAAKDPFDFDDAPAPAAAPQKNGGAFSFDDTAGGAKEDDPFASLLESNSQTEGDPFASLAAPAAAPAAPANSPGEFDLNSFSWDETPAPGAAAPEAPPASTVDEFDALFGDMDDAAKK